MKLRILIGMLVIACLGWYAAAALADSPDLSAQKPADAKQANGKSPDAKSNAANEKLDAEQAKLAEKYNKLEKTFGRLAELVATTDPKQAALLRQAFAESRSRLIDDQLNQLVEQLTKDQLYSASKGQVQVQTDLTRLLELLQSGDSAKKEKSERELIHNLLGQLDKMIKQEEGIHGQTEGEGDLKDLSEQQRKEAEKAKQLGNDIRQLEPKSESDASKPSDDQKPAEKNTDKPQGEEQKPSGDKNGPKSKGNSGKKTDGAKSAKSGNQPSDKKAQKPAGNSSPEKKSPDKNSSGKNSADKNSTDKNSPDKNSPGDKAAGKQSGDKNGQKSAKPGQGQSQGQGKSQGQPQGQGQGQGQSQGQGEEQEDKASNPSATPQGDEASPARQRVEAAEQRMWKAKQHLEQAKRKDAAEEQTKAIQELKVAKAELEKILRQLREEEVERVLAQLEARFRHMLTLQIEVYEGTIRLDKVPLADRGHDEEVETGRLSHNEANIVVEADRALNLLHEEGSAVAFPEAVDETRDEMQQVVDRLADMKVESITQGTEQDIITALQETIAALQRAQKDHKMKKGGAGKGGQPDDGLLLDQIAELKMIRALQMRVNTRTKRYSRLLEGDVEQADRPDLISALKHLADREDRIHQVTHDIVVGKNH